MQKAWRERNPSARIKAAHQAIQEDNEYVVQYCIHAIKCLTWVMFINLYAKGETIRSILCKSYVLC